MCSTGARIEGNSSAGCRTLWERTGGQFSYGVADFVNDTVEPLVQSAESLDGQDDFLGYNNVGDAPATPTG